MLNEENNKEMEIEENKQTIPDEQPLDKVEEKPEEKKDIKEKQKNKIIKRAPMEKTIDETIKEFNKLLQDEVSIFFSYALQEPDIDKFESLFEKLKKEKEKKEIFYLFMKTFDKIQGVSNIFFIFYSSEMN